MKCFWKLPETSAVEPVEEMQMNERRPPDTLIPDFPGHWGSSAPWLAPGSEEVGLGSIQPKPQDVSEIQKWIQQCRKTISQQLQLISEESLKSAEQLRRTG